MDGYVALLDVLGFSALIGADRSGALTQKYLNRLEEATLLSDVGYVVFSDSIVLTTKGDGPESFIAIARACSRLLGGLLDEGIALRGAIAYGDFVRKAVGESLFVAGRAVIDAYGFEKLQDWVGIMVTPSALTRMQDLEKRCRMENYSDVYSFVTDPQRLAWPAFIQHCHNIPFSGNLSADPGNFDGFAVVPTNGIAEPASIAGSIYQAIERLSWLRKLAPTPRAQRKYQVTSTWLGSIHPIWREVIRFSHSQ